MTSFSREDLMPLETGVLLPAKIKNYNPSAKTIIYSHGLGAKNPKEKNHDNDVWTILIDHASTSSNVSSVNYTARGHGNSTGWESTAEANPDQFTWNYLSHDMVAVGNYFALEKFFVGGSSMGGASAFYTALNYPDRVLGVVMIRPPTAWEARKSRRKVVLSSANKCRDENPPNEKHHFVLRGTSNSDLPPLDRSDIYSQICCPFLILAVSDDPKHPLSTAQALAASIPHSELHVADSATSAKKSWPALISEFLERTNAPSTATVVVGEGGKEL